MSDETAARILHIERQEHKRALRDAFLRGARAAKAQILDSLETARVGNPTCRYSVIDFIATLPDPEYTEGEQE